MVLKVSVKHDIDKLARMYRKQGKLVPKYMAQALNKTGQQVQTAAGRQVAKEMGLKVGDAKAGLTRRKAFRQRLITEITARGRPLNLVRFAAKEVRRGISAKAWGRRKIYKGAFFINDQRTVMRRRGRARLPIVPMYGPGVAPTYAGPEVTEAINRTIRTRWPINMGQSINFMLAKTRT